MGNYEIEVPEGVPADIRVSCADHGVSETFPGNRRSVAFHCPDCGVDVEITIHDTEDWRPLTEQC